MRRLFKNVKKNKIIVENDEKNQLISKIVKKK